MTDYIFESKIWLRMKNASIEKSYLKFRSKSINCWINSLSIFGLVASAFNSIFQIFFVDGNTSKSSFPYLEITYLSYVVSAINLVLSILILLIKNKKFKKNLYYFQYFTLGIALFSTNFSAAFYNVDTSKRFNFYGVEALVRIVSSIGFFEFIDCFIMTMIDIVSVLALYLIFTKCEVYGFLYAYLIFTFCFIIVSYLIVYTRKINYFFSEKHKLGRDWFKNIIEKMKSGFINVKDNKICLINDFMKEIIFRNSDIVKKIGDLKEKSNPQMMSDNQIFRNELFDIKENSKDILTELMKDLNNDTDHDELKNFQDLLVENNHVQRIDTHIILHSFPSEGSNKVSFLELFKTQNCSSGNIFHMVGTRTLRIEKNSRLESLTFEVFCRYKFNQEKKFDEFDIIFNDVTKAKQIEERKSEMKYKSIFLSKVAHEFKNPLISIKELVDQLIENFRHLKERDKEIIMKCQDNLNQIQSFSNFLMILIKDFDYFSQKEIMMKKVSIEIEHCELKEILKFCNEIALSLLKRNGKDKSIKFELETADDVPDYIRTDEFKLKQVLVNLISNAIKFTNQGIVKLKVNKQESDIVFRVSDTGVGIAANKINNLFASDNSFTGSSLGMCIIFNLTSALGKRIEITSELDRGSDFIFSIPIEGNKIKENFIDQNNIEIIESSYSYSNSINNYNYKRIDSYNLSEMSAANLIREDLVSPRESNLIQKKSLFYKNSSSHLDMIDINDAKFYDSEINHGDIDIIDGESSINDSIVEFSDKNISSKRTVRISDFKFFNDKFLLPSPSNKIKSKKHINLELSQFPEEKNKPQFYSGEQINSTFSSFTNTDYIMNTNNKPGSIKMLKIENLLEKNNINYENSEDIKKKDEIKSAIQSIAVIGNTDILSDFIFEFKFFDLLNFKEETDYVNIILVDDEKLTRSANRRLITIFAKKNNIKVNFIEAEDGFECLYLLYICIKKGVKISCVISDQTMNYLDGTVTAKVLKELAHSDKMFSIPFYILTAYEDENIIKKLKLSPITNIFSKPINKIFIEQIFDEITRSNKY